MSHAIALAPEAEHVLQAARDIAIERGEPQISPHVLLFALSVAGDPPVRETLGRHALGPDTLRTWLDSAIGAPIAPRKFQPGTPFSMRTAAILEAAEAEAMEAGRGNVGAGDLLVGILREPAAPTGAAAAALVRHGATYDRIRSELSH